MTTADSVKAKIQGLIQSANAKTGSNDVDLTAAVNALIAGFGQGGGSSGGITLLESGSFTLASETSRHNVELTQVPDLFICYAEVPETDTSFTALDGAVFINVPQIANMISYKTNYVTNVSAIINWYNDGAHKLLEDYGYISKKDTVITANIVARSNSYKLKAKTYKWESYRLWE